MTELLGDLYNSPTYRCWNAIKNQCHNERSQQFKNYGAKGVTVCDRWRQSFLNFVEDMGLRPDLDHTILRRDGTGNYEPSNCYWGLSVNPGNKRHGATGTSEFKTWVSMKKRCVNPNDTSYADYGGRGIKVCDAWMRSFEAFFADVGPRPSQRHTIDRINNDGNYEPGNVRWATKSQQMVNRRPFKKYSQNPDKRKTYWVVDGEKLGFEDIAERYGLNKKTVWSRLVQQGWTVERCIATPTRKLTKKEPE